MGISFGAVTNTTANAASVTYSHTIGDGDDKVLIVDVGASNSSIPNASGVSFSGIALTRFNSFGQSSSETADIWYLVNPPSVTANVIVSMVSTRKFSTGAISYFGVDQDNPFPASGTAGATGGGTRIVPITTLFDNSWVHTHYAERQVSTLTTNLTQRYNQGTVGTPANSNTTAIGDDRTTTTAGAYSGTYTTSNVNISAAIAMEIKEAPGKNQCFIL